MNPKDTTRTLPHGTKLNKKLKTLIFVNTALTFAVGMFAPFYAVFVEKIGGGAVLAGVSWAIFQVISGILILVLSKWELRIGKRHVLLAMGYLIRSIAFLSYAYMNTVSQLLITQVLWGIASALGTPAFDALYTSSVSEETAIVEWGDWEGISSIATGIAALVGGVLVQAAGFKILFLFMSLITASLGIYLLYQRYQIRNMQKLKR